MKVISESILAAIANPSMHCAAGHEFTRGETGRGPCRACPFVLRTGAETVTDLVRPKKCGKPAHLGPRSTCIRCRTEPQS